MFPKDERLVKKKDFQELFQKGKVIKGKLLILKIKKSKEKKSKFTAIVSQKVAKKAPERNRIKRRIRDIAKRALKDQKRGLNIAVIALARVKSATFGEIEKEFNKLLKKIGNEHI